MQKLIVKAKKLNKRQWVPNYLPDPMGIIGVVKEDFTFQGEEVMIVPNPALGKWYRDRDNKYYWGGGLLVVEEITVENDPNVNEPDNNILEQGATITPVTKRKIEHVINAFETGSAEGNYATLVKLKDYNDPETHTLMKQITYGRSQTTEFGHLKALVQDYVDHHGLQANALKPYLNKIGKKPSLWEDDTFCNALKGAGKNDPIMKSCQDGLFEAKYYQPAFSWFTKHGFTMPLSMLVIYDSYIHSGSIRSFLRNKFATVVPASGGSETEWITNYIDARHNWLAHQTNHLLRNTVYRTDCFKKQLELLNWDLSQTINAHGVKIN